MKTINFKIEKVMKTMVASLIILVSFSGISKGVNTGSEATDINGNELAVQVKSWISSSTYWDLSANIDNIDAISDGTVEKNLNIAVNAENQELGQEMKSWMSNSAYWNGKVESDDQDLARQIKSWMNNGTYWSSENENQNQL
jgi:hypothetical protein